MSWGAKIYTCGTVIPRVGLYPFQGTDKKAQNIFSALYTKSRPELNALQIFDDPTKKQKTEGLGLTGSGRHQRFEIKC